MGLTQSSAVPGRSHESSKKEGEKAGEEVFFLSFTRKAGKKRERRGLLGKGDGFLGGLY